MEIKKNRKNIPLFLFVFLFILFSCKDNSASNKTTHSHDYQTGNQEKPGITGTESGYKKEFQWTAYKTNRKVPVSGTFKKISLTNVREDKPLEESLEGAKFYLDGTTLTSWDTARDGTLITFFFKRLSSTDITGSFGKFANNKVFVFLSLDGKTVTKEFSYSVKENAVTLKGSIDILKDFDAQKAFTSLHRACYDLHEGKTWSEVDLIAKISR
ncbi:MAG: YceI family protein [Flavobacteriaceae bacterium]|jgi:hypothetical protein|nr:YceI family protein [Flavobacteriaceae bacterium]